jgi:lipopolysaccharide transport system ATP-binding protein
MADIPIRVDHLGKRYLLRHAAQGHKKYTALRDVLTEAAAAPFRRLRQRFKASERNGATAGDGLTQDGTREDFWALKDVSFEIKRGESVGIIGRNGAGKSTLLKLLSRITAPTTGRIELDGKIASLLEVGTGFHPELTGRENIFLNGAILGMKRAEIRRKFHEIVAFAEVEKFLDTPVKHYSSGMYVRLAFAVAAHLEPDVLIVDEVLAVGDAEFQKRCLGKMQSVSKEEGRTVLFVSHNMQAVRQMCTRVIMLSKGSVVANTDPGTAISTYLSQGMEAGSFDTVDFSTYPRLRAPENARLLRLRFVNAKGQPVNRLRLEEALTVELDFAVQKRLVQTNISMAVLHAEGMRVFSEAYSDQHELPDLAPGSYTVSFHIPMRFFKLESYFLSVTLVEDGARHCDFIEGMPLPELVIENPNLHMETNRWGVLRVPVVWDLIKAATKPS